MTAKQTYEMGSSMISISIFNNKGGVGKTTLTFHLANALTELGHKTLIIDVDPQCNLTIFAMDPEHLHKIWAAEDDYIDDFGRARGTAGQAAFEELISQTRSVHFLLKPTEDGTAELEELPPPFEMHNGLGIIPGRLTMHMYEDKIASRWSDVYQGDPLAVKTVTQLLTIARAYGEKHGYEYVIMDTSPSLGVMNKVVISTADCFLIPCAPDMFSLYGVRNIGKSLGYWKKQFDTIYQLLPKSRRMAFPKSFVQFLGYTIYNAKKYAGNNKWDLAKANYHYATQIPETIKTYINSEVRSNLPDDLLKDPVGGTAIMHTHNTLPSMAQKYHVPIWEVPGVSILEAEDKGTILGNRAIYEGTREKYCQFAAELLGRIDLVNLLG